MPIKRQIKTDRMEAFGHHIKVLRERTPGLSQGRVAGLLGVPRATYLNWEHGRRIPDALTVADLARILGVDPGELLAGVPVVPTSPLPEPKRRGRPPIEDGKPAEKTGRKKKGE